MPHRRLLRGKKLLVAAGLAGVSLVACDDTSVANLVAPPDSGDLMDANTDEDAGEPSDAQVIGFPDAPVANLLPPPDSGYDASEPASDAGEAEDDAGFDSGFPVANLLPPPDGSF